MEGLISIVIPVYNAEKTIERTLKSLANNQYQLELICVNDGSSDRSESIIRSFQENDKRIQLINQSNGGAASARNTGISHANGSYILFCDADDEYSDNTLECIIDDIDQYSPDYIIFGRSACYENGSTVYYLNNSNERVLLNCDWEEYFNKVMKARNHSHVVYNRAYRTQIIREHGIHFAEDLRLSEDLYFNFFFVQFAKVILEDGRCKYIQHKTIGSITRSKTPDFFEQNIKVLDNIDRCVERFHQRFQPFIDNHVISTAVLAVHRALIGRDGHSLHEKREIIHKVLTNKEFLSASERYNSYNNSNSTYQKRKTLLITHRRVFLYWIRYVLLPRIKERLIKHG